MFLLNSCLGLFLRLDVTPVPLIPKLRGQFAEFLNNASLAHLRIFFLIYLCRFAVRVSIYNIYKLFSPLLLDNSLLYFHYIFRYESFLFLAYLPLLCPLCSFKYSGSAGISTCCPSDTPFGLSLGPDLP